MIQRIQTVYLFLASVALSLLFLFPIYTFDKIDEQGKTVSSKIYISGKQDKVGEQYTLTEKTQFPMVFSLVIGIALLISIFLYESRKEQLMLARVLIILEFVLLIMVFYNVSKEVSNTGITNVKYSVGAFLPSIAILFTALGARGIRKDMQLIKAADRLR